MSRTTSNRCSHPWAARRRSAPARQAERPAHREQPVRRPSRHHHPVHHPTAPAVRPRTCHATLCPCTPTCPSAPHTPCLLRGSLRCSKCDFKVVRFDDQRWSDSVDYMFFRNFMGNLAKLRTLTLTLTLTLARTRTLTRRPGQATSKAGAAGRGRRVRLPVQLVHDRQLGRQGAPRLLVPNAMTVPEAGRIAAVGSWTAPLGNSGSAPLGNSGRVRTRTVVHVPTRHALAWGLARRLNTRTHLLARWRWCETYF